jgi:hypothetical protein
MHLYKYTYLYEYQFIYLYLCRSYSSKILINEIKTQSLEHGYMLNDFNLAGLSFEVPKHKVNNTNVHLHVFKCTNIFTCKKFIYLYLHMYVYMHTYIYGYMLNYFNLAGLSFEVPKHKVNNVHHILYTLYMSIHL